VLLTVGIEIIGNPTLADAILDRIVHHAHRIEHLGDSLRKIRKPDQVVPKAPRRSAQVIGDAGTNSTRHNGRLRFNRVVPAVAQHGARA
jgi:hypothetical protein